MKIPISEARCRLPKLVRQAQKDPTGSEAAAPYVVVTSSLNDAPCLSFDGNSQALGLTVVQ